MCIDDFDAIRPGFGWFVVYTHAKCEARAEAGIKGLGYSTYLPMEKRWIRHARYKRAEERPLLARYLFVGFDPLEKPWSPIRQVQGVCDLVLADGAPKRMGPRDVAMVAALKASQMVGAFDQTRAVERMCAGDSVEVVAGPFSGFIGQLQSADNAQARAEILVSFLGKDHSVGMDFEQLRPVI